MKHHGGLNRSPTLLAWVMVWMMALMGTGPSFGVDCNTNGVNDEVDILLRNSDDCNGNNVPDECDVFPLSFLSSPSSQLGVGIAPSALDVADLDGGGVLDLAVASAPILDGYVSTFLQGISGAFATSICSPLQIDKSPTAIVAAYLDGDANIDLAVAYNGGFTEIGGVDILLNLGTGGCSSPATWSPFIGPFRPVAMVAADFDGDLDTDLVVAGTEDVSVLLNNASGAFTMALGSPFLDGTGPSAIVAGDFNGDNQLDVAIADSAADEVVVALNNGEVRFPTAAHVAVSSEPVALAAADLDKDGDLDLVSANAGGNNLSILINTAGLFLLHRTIPVGHGPAGLAAADFDGDGNMDLAASNATDDSMTVLLGPSFAVKRSFPTGAAPGPIAARDLDANGDVDMVVINVDSNTASIMLAAGPDSADADDDGVPDECGGTCGAGTLAVLPLMSAILLGLRLPFLRRSAVPRGAH